MWGCGGIRLLLLFLSLWRQRPEKKIGLGRLPQTLKITLPFLIPSPPTHECHLHDQTGTRPGEDTPGWCCATVNKRQYGHEACSQLLFYLVTFNGEIRSRLGSEGELHIIKGTQNESFIIYVLEIGFMEPNGSISLL